MYTKIYRETSQNLLKEEKWTKTHWLGSLSIKITKCTVHRFPTLAACILPALTAPLHSPNLLEHHLMLPIDLAVGVPPSLAGQFSEPYFSAGSRGAR